MKIHSPADTALAVKRTESGALDHEFYERRARQLRAEAVHAWIGTIAAFSAKAWKRIESGARRAATQRSLNTLDARALKDIGLTSGDVTAVASGEFFVDPTRRQRGNFHLTAQEHAMPRTVCWMNGTITPPEHACISILDHGLLYGDGVFEGIRFYRGRAFRLDAHLDRLYRSAAALRLGVPYDRPALRDEVAKTIAAFPADDGYLRLVVTRGEGKLGLDPESCARPNVFMIADKLAMVDQATRQRGARVIVAATRRLAPDGLDPRVKSLNYLNHILARIEATNAGADEAILLNGSGHVAEGTADNVFVVRDGVLLTPPPSDGALEGITRSVVMELADQEKIAVRETSLGPYDLYTADECFLTGTGAELIPVREVDGRPTGKSPGPVFQRLSQAFARLVREESTCVAA